MPVVVEKTIEARYVKAGDEVILLHRSHSELVADVSIPRGPNAKYASISTDYGVTKIALNNEVTVYREEPTEEEKREQETERANVWIRESMAKAAWRVEHYREELIDNLHIKTISWHGRSWQSYAEAQISVEIWEAVVKVAVNHKCGLIEATHKWAAKLTEEIINEVKFGSRSSSDMHNMTKALTLQVQSAWVDDLRWRI